MIWIYTGTPGSGKSLNATLRIFNDLSQGINVIANFAINQDMIRWPVNVVAIMRNVFEWVRCKVSYVLSIYNKNVKERPYTKVIATHRNVYEYWDNDSITVDRLVDFAQAHHKKNKEHQTLLVVDEASVIWDAREWNMERDVRKKWEIFFAQHRKLGYDIILISQVDRAIDKRIRSLAEYEVIHRKGNNFKFIGLFLTIMQIKVFFAIERWYVLGLKNGHRIFFYRRKYSKMYDTYAMFKRDESLSNTSPNALALGEGDRGVPSPMQGIVGESESSGSNQPLSVDSCAMAQGEA